MADSEAVTEGIPVVEESQAEDGTVTSGETEPVEETAETKRTHVRAGFTKNHNQGQSKQRRKMANKSRRINRQRR